MAGANNPYVWGWNFGYFLGLYFIMQGSYWWAKEKGRNGWWSLMGLLAPIGYIVLMKLKNRLVEHEVRGQNTKAVP